MTYNYNITDANGGAGLASDGTGYATRYANGTGFRYGPSFWRRFSRWMPNPGGGTPVGGTNIIPYLFCHGGFVTSPFKRSAQSGFDPVALPAFAAQITNTLSSVQQSAGRPLIALISMEFNPGWMGLSRIAYPEYTFLPTQTQELYWCAQYLADHYDDPEIWGVGNAIDPSTFLVGGMSQGAQLSSIAAFQPSGYQKHGGVDGMAYAGSWGRRFSSTAEPRIRAAWLDEPWIDQSQASSKTPASTGNDDNAGLAEMNGGVWIASDIDPHLNIPGDNSVTSLIPRAQLKESSPWWWAKRGLRKPATVGDSGPDTLMCNLFYNLDNIGVNATWTPGVPNPTWINTHSHASQASNWLGLMIEHGFIDPASMSTNLSEVWYPNPTAGNGAGDAQTTTGTAVHQAWMTDKVLPNLT